MKSTKPSLMERGRSLPYGRAVPRAHPGASLAKPKAQGSPGPSSTNYRHIKPLHAAHGEEQESGDRFSRLQRTLVSGLCAVTLTANSLLPPPPDALALPSYEDLGRQVGVGRVPKKDASSSGRGPDSNMPSAGESQALLALNEDLFTEDAWLGMLRIADYARYIEDLQDAEEEPGCEQCEENRKILEKTWQVVSNEFYDPTGKFSQSAWAGQLLNALESAGGTLHTKEQTYAAIEKMVKTLGDPYSEFMPPSKFRRAIRRPTPAERSYLQTQYVGVGIQPATSTRTDAGWTVGAPLAGSPAESAGIRQGDILMAVDGIPTSDLSASELEALLRGPAESEVQVEVRSATDADDDGVVTLERRGLPQPALRSTMLPSGRGRAVQYMRMYYFSSDGSAALAEALRRGESDPDVDGFVLDLRNNPGGVFEEAVAQASLMLQPEAIVAKTVRNMEVIDNVWQVSHLSSDIFPNLPGQLASKPIVVIVNSSTASASEVLAGALQDNGRAILVGEQTFGKGVVQYYFPMTDGSGLKVTVAKYLTPGHDISRDGGLVPDIACSDFPHGVLTNGPVDACVRTAMKQVGSLKKKPPVMRTPTMEVASVSAAEE